MARTTATEIAWRTGVLDDYVRALVKTQPVPRRLIENFRREAEGEPFIPQRAHRKRRGDQIWEKTILKRYGVRRAHPDEMDTRLHRVLTLLCHGLEVEFIAKEIRYSAHTVRELNKVLLIMFDARNRSHLCALAVARGYVKMTNA